MIGLLWRPRLPNDLDWTGLNRAQGAATAYASESLSVTSSEANSTQVARSGSTTGHHTRSKAEEFRDS
ncbi:hypothetical protein KC363_g139 [Hortaea werneckii]|nr:hypothetical protein KC363_g139 [Hortaea werneckii]